MTKKKAEDPQIEFIDLASSLGGCNTLKEKLYDKGIYYLTGQVESNSLLEIHQDILLKHLDPTWNDDIQLIVNSVGGDTSEGWALIDLLDWVRMDIRTTGIGICASLGAMFLASGTPGKRVAARNLSLMVHGASIEGLGGNYPQLVCAKKDMELEYGRMLRFWVEHSKYMSEEEVKKLFLDGFDHWISPEEALAHNIIDFIIPKK
jgi:ATP-dependent Clp protease protease subunit